MLKQIRNLAQAVKPSSIRRRTYASISNSIRIRIDELDELDEFLRRHTFAPGVQALHLSLGKSWTKWEDIDTTQREQQHEDEPLCKAKIPRMLRALNASPAIAEVILCSQEITQLPVRVSERRTPTGIFQTMDIACSCIDVGLWTFDSWPKVRVEHQPTRKALLQARQLDGVHSWQAFVASSRNPLHQAFDFTADFHSRDLTTSRGELEGEKSWIDLAPHGQGYYRIPGEDIDGLSMCFASDLEENVKYFDEGGEWKPGIYEQLRSENDGHVSSRLGPTSMKEAVASIEVDRPISELSERTLGLLVKKLLVEDDEEVYFEQRSVRKRKKTKGHEEDEAIPSQT